MSHHYGTQVQNRVCFVRRPELLDRALEIVRNNPHAEIKDISAGMGLHPNSMRVGIGRKGPDWLWFRQTLIDHGWRGVNRSEVGRRAGVTARANRLARKEREFEKIRSAPKCVFCGAGFGLHTSPHGEAYCYLCHNGAYPW